MLMTLQKGVWSGVESDGVIGNYSRVLKVPSSKLSDRIEIVTNPDQSFSLQGSSEWSLGAWDPIISPVFRPMVLNADNQAVLHVAGQKPWKNFVSPHDINNDGKTSVLDALMIINELSRGVSSTSIQTSSGSRRA